MINKIIPETDFAFSLFWDDIRYFLAVANDCSLNSASKRLGVSHTTVGRRIKVFEEALRTELFERKGNYMVLTEEGHQVLIEANKIVESIQNLQKIVVNSSKIEGDVKIYVTEGIASFWLMPRMYDFQQKHPGLKINWFISNKDPFELGKDVDIAFRWSRPKEPYAITKKLTTVKYSSY